jgi:hypothetical protein
MGELPVSQLMDARMKLADQKGLYAQSLADGFVALAKLDKIAGKPGYYTKLIVYKEKLKEEKTEPKEAPAAEKKQEKTEEPKKQGQPRKQKQLAQIKQEKKYEGPKFNYRW